MLYIFLLGGIAAFIAYRSVRNVGTVTRHLLVFVALALVVGFLSVLIFQFLFFYPSDRYFKMAPIYGAFGGLVAFASPIIGFFAGWVSRRRKTIIT